MRAAVVLGVALQLVLPVAASGQPTGLDELEGLQGLEEEPAVVRFSFGWRPGLRIEAVDTRTRVRLAKQPSRRSLTARYALRVEAEGDGLRIRLSDASFELEGKGPAALAPEEARTLVQAASLLPDYRVSRSGEFAGLHDLSGFRERLRAFLADLLPDDFDPRAQEKLDELLTSRALLESRAAEQWNSLVGAWVGAELELGATYTYSSREAMPLTPDQPVRMEYAFSVERRLPCRRGEVERTCAEVVMTVRPDARDTGQMVRTLLGELAGEHLPESAVFESIEIDNTVRLVTEPDGLFPHSLSVAKTVRGSISVEGETEKMEQVEKARVVYTYGGTR